jgi:hypothetical protein
VIAEHAAALVPTPGAQLWSRASRRSGSRQSGKPIRREGLGAATARGSSRRGQPPAWSTRRWLGPVTHRGLVRPRAESRPGPQRPARSRLPHGAGPFRARAPREALLRAGGRAAGIFLLALGEEGEGPRRWGAISGRGHGLVRNGG